MNTKTQTQNPSETMAGSSGKNLALGFAVIGLLAAGAVGVLKALTMVSGVDVLLCLLGSVAAFGAVFYIYLARR
jgi:hypothetical protein